MYLWSRLVRWKGGREQRVGSNDSGYNDGGSSTSVGSGGAGVTRRVSWVEPQPGIMILFGMATIEIAAFSNP